MTKFCRIFSGVPMIRELGTSLLRIHWELQRQIGVHLSSTVPTYTQRTKCKATYPFPGLITPLLHVVAYTSAKQKNHSNTL
jgi:hypothetical protein